MLSKLHLGYQTLVLQAKATNLERHPVPAKHKYFLPWSFAILFSPLSFLDGMMEYFNGHEAS